MLEQLERYWFSDKTMHLNVIFHYQVKKGNAGLVIEVLGNISSARCALSFFCDYKKNTWIWINACIAVACHLSHGNCLNAGAQLSPHGRSCCLSETSFIAY